MRLIHPDDVAADQTRQGLAALANKQRIVAHVQSHIARKRAGARVDLRQVDPGTGQKR